MIEVSLSVTVYFRYFSFVTNHMNPSEHSRLNNWKNTDGDEIYLFLAVTFLIARNSKLSLNDCWSKDVLLNTPIFSNTMPRDRYLLLLRLLHFCDNMQQEEGNRLYKLDMVIHEFKECFRDNFIPFETLCIDETIVPFKGRLSFKQYIKGKRHKFGVKLFSLADTETDYILNFVIYLGSATKWPVFREELGVTGSSVLSLMKNYLKKGHTLYTDNWYTSPRLAEFLHKKKTNYCGTVRKNRKEMPKLEAKLKKGEVCSRHNNRMMVLKWQDKRQVCMLSTFHENKMIPTNKCSRETGEPILKPISVVDYNQHMGTIDKIDMLISPMSCIQKSVKWYKKVFFHLINYAVLNSYSMYKINTGAHTTFATFQLELTRQLIAKYKKTPRGSQGGRPASGDIPNRLVDRHFPSLVASKPGRSNRQRVCHVCAHTQMKSKKRHDSRYECVQCNVGVCIPECFRIFHTVKKY